METVNQFAEALDFNMARHWSPTVENFFGRVNKTVIQAAVTEATGVAAARKLDGLKKPVMAAEAAKLVSDAGWLPGVLRTKAQYQEWLAAE
jgi:ParB family chromosome partitioning protein